MAYWLNDTAPYSSTKQLQFFMDADSDKSNLPTSSADGVSQGEDVADITNY